MELLFRRGLSLIICWSVGAQVFAADAPAATTTPATGDKLDNEAEVGLQQSINDIYTKYNSQIAGMKAQSDQLNSTGKSQCALEAKNAQNEAAQGESAAKMQALQGMMQPGAETLGHVVDAGLKGVSGEKAAKEAALAKTIELCTNTEHLACDKDGANPLPVTETNCPGSTPKDASTALQSSMIASGCKTNFNTDAARYSDKIASLSKEIKDTGGAMDGLVSSGMQLAAAGISGIMMNKQAKETAAYMKESADGQEALCNKQIDAQITALTNQIAQLEAAKARDLLMANMMAEYQTKVRRKNQVQNDPTATNTTNGGSIDVGSGAPFQPYVRPVQTVPFANKGGGGGANAPAGGGAGGGAGGASAPNWDFGGGAGFDGGSRLPDQPESATYAGSGMSASVVPKNGSGFGALEAKGAGAGDAERDPASEGEVLGDGGLRVLMARASLIHTRHATTLMKSIDFDRLAKTQGISPRPASASNAGPN
ncbi:MAG: hypothetical protein ABIR96_00040 [Bdellovibrionota bacterium]